MGDPNMPTSTLYDDSDYTRSEIQRGLAAFHFITTAVVKETDRAVVSSCVTAKGVLTELEKVYDPDSQGSNKAMMTEMFRFSIPAHSSSNPIEHLNKLEQIYLRLREKALNADTPFVLAHFVVSLPPEYQQPKFLVETATTLDTGEIVRIVSTVHASLPEGRKASKGQRKAGHTFLLTDGSSRGGASGRSNGGRRKGGGGRGGGQKGKGGGSNGGGGGGGGNSGGSGGGGEAARTAAASGVERRATRRPPVPSPGPYDARSAWATGTTRASVRLSGRCSRWNCRSWTPPH